LKKNKKLRLVALFVISVGLILLIAFMTGAQPARASAFVLEDTPLPSIPTPGPTPTPTPGGGGGITEIFHNIIFPLDTISKSLGRIFSDAFKGENAQLILDYATCYQAIGEIIQAPSAGVYAGVAQSSWPVAAALAPALFILRIALYHWSRFVGEEDSAKRAAGDILTALVLAVVCGAFLDLIVRLGWWMTGAAVGEAGSMAMDFYKSLSFVDAIQGLAETASLSFMLPLIFIAVELGALLAAAGMLMAFAAANAGLFLLAVLGPSIAVVGALPQMRWMRSLWIKAVSVIALLPLIAGGIFKASIYMSSILVPGGMLALLIRLMWLWGATGAMLSLAGILGKMTITTTADAAGQLVKAVADVAGMIAIGAATGGAGLAAGAGAVGAGAAGGAGGLAGGAGGLTAGAAGAGGLAAGVGSGEAAGLASASFHLGAAQNLNTIGGYAQALGLKGTAGLSRALSSGESLAARQAELSSRMGRVGGAGIGRGGEKNRPKDDGEEISPPDTGGGSSGGQSAGSGRSLPFDVADNVWQDALRGFGGPEEKLGSAYTDMSRLLNLNGRDIPPENFLSAHAQQAGLMSSIYSSERNEIDKKPDPLMELLERAGGRPEWIENA
jgi:hypothetical protein